MNVIQIQINIEMNRKNTSAMKAIADRMGKLDEMTRDGATWQQCY